MISATPGSPGSAPGSPENAWGVPRDVLWARGPPGKAPGPILAQFLLSGERPGNDLQPISHGPFSLRNSFDPPPCRSCVFCPIWTVCDWPVRALAPFGPNLAKCVDLGTDNPPRCWPHISLGQDRISRSKFWIEFVDQFL